jgi:hypothetical protein
LGQHLIRGISALFILILFRYLVPGFTTLELKSALFIALSIAMAGWLIEVLIGHAISPFARGMIGILTTIGVLVLTYFFIPNHPFSLIGIVLASILIGMIDIFVPTGARYNS